LRYLRDTPCRQMPDRGNTRPVLTEERVSRSLHEMNDVELLELYEHLAEHAAPGLAMVSQELANRRAEAGLARIAVLPERLLRAVAFVDAGYLRNLGARELGCSEADVFIVGPALREWLRALVAPYRFLRTYVYDGRFPSEHPRAVTQAVQLDELADTSQIRLRLGVLRDRDRGRGPSRKGWTRFSSSMLYRWLR